MVWVMGMVVGVTRRSTTTVVVVVVKQRGVARGR
jgi:hypothetical protein